MEEDEERPDSTVNLPLPTEVEYNGQVDTKKRTGDGLCLGLQSGNFCQYRTQCKGRCILTVASGNYGRVGI